VGEVKERLEQIIRQVADELGIKVLELSINPNHVNLLISAYPTIPVHKIIRRIKGRSSNILRREFPELLRPPPLWTHSYYVSAIGAASKENIEKYIEAQKGV
jgi:putative transposase